MNYTHHIRETRPVRRRSCLGCLGRLCLLSLWLIPLLAVAVAAFVLSFVLFPPFGNERSARVLLIGLDKEERGVSRSDTIMLYGVKLAGGGATLLSVPRDARVRIPGHYQGKINAAYAEGKHTLLQETLRQPSVLAADLPYYVVFDSTTVANMIDALGGIEVVVPHDMDYDDNWGGLHIHLKKGNRHLDGQETVGFLRWRKNNRGRGPAGDDFARAERQRQVLVAIKDKLRTWDGITRLPKLYRVFREDADSNLSLTQLLLLGWHSRQIQTDAVPGTPRPIRGVSYVICDWEAGRRLWRQAIE